MDLLSAVQSLSSTVPHTIINTPEALEEFGIIVLVALAAVALHALLQRRLRSDAMRRHNDVAGFLFSAVSVIYAVVLGFVVVVVWQKYDATVDNVEEEVASVADLYHSVDAYPQTLRSQIRSELLTYVNRMIVVEWPMMANDTYVTGSSSLLEEIGAHVDALKPADERQSNAQQSAMAQVLRLYDARRERLVHAAPSMPAILWFALLLGAVAMLAFAYLFGVENRPAQLVMTAILAGVIAMFFVVIYEFDSPFSGSVSISDSGWVYLQHVLRHIP
jgi:sterol desaturase/sphingolipid hydroxylase (fatty acid hydroxylase superfamily)